MASTSQVAVFYFDRRCGGPIVSTILGANFTGAIGVNRWSAYKNVTLRQLCWAHLLRDFVAMSERGRLFVERHLTVLTLQKRNVFDYIGDAMTAYSAGKPAPSILPVSSHG